MNQRQLSVWCGLKVAILAGCLFGLTGGAKAGEMSDLSAEMTIAQTSTEVVWRSLGASERQDAIDQILRSPMGVAALNQLAIEGFIAFNCEKSYYRDETGFRLLLQVTCPTPRGISSAVGYDEMRVIYNSFEGNIEFFEVERHGGDLGSLPLRTN
ncbi:MAG: hypothetical protein ACP5D7_14700 [Limnospira sp.]